MTLDDIVAALGSAPVVLERLVRGLSEEQLRAGHDADTWSIKEVVIHLRDADEISLVRMERMAHEETPFLPAYDQAAYARERGYQEGDALSALAGFAANRERMVALLGTLPSGGLDRPGTHEETGRITIGSLAEHMIAHDISHLAQIARGLS